MNDILDIEIILKRKKYHPIYNLGIIITIIIVIFIYISMIYKYKTYYINKGIMVDGNIKILVDTNDLKYIIKNNKLEIENKNYKYTIEKIGEDLLVDEQFKNYKYIYLKVNSINNLNNYVYEIKIGKENKKIIDYLIDYI